MKLLTLSINTIFVTLLTLVATSLFQSQFSGFLSGERLEGRVVIGPWIDRQQSTPSIEAKSSEIPEIKAAKESVKRTIDALEDAIDGGDLALKVARIDIKNETSKVVTDIKIRMNSRYEHEEIHLIDEQGERTILKENPQLIALPDLKPGERTVIFMWATAFYSDYSMPSSISTYSSAGAINLSYRWPRVEDATITNSVSWFFEDWAPWLIGGLTITLGLLLAIVATFNENYSKAMLRDEDFFLDEKMRFDLDPKKFKPDFDRANSVRTA